MCTICGNSVIFCAWLSFISTALRRQQDGGIFKSPHYPGYPFLMIPDLTNPYLSNGSLSPSARTVSVRVQISFSLFFISSPPAKTFAVRKSSLCTATPPYSLRVASQGVLTTSLFFLGIWISLCHTPSTRLAFDNFSVCSKFRHFSLYFLFGMTYGSSLPKIHCICQTGSYIVYILKWTSLIRPYLLSCAIDVSLLKRLIFSSLEVCIPLKCVLELLDIFAHYYQIVFLFVLTVLRETFPLL